MTDPCTNVKLLPVLDYLKLECKYIVCVCDICTDIVQVPGYSESICGPMMLGRVKLNMENNDYQTVQEFVSAIEYVFHHWASNRVSFSQACKCYKLQES